MTATATDTVTTSPAEEAIAPKPTTLERIHGGLLGVAAGDSLGATLEFMTPTQIKAEHGQLRDIVGGGAFNWRPGQGTDDTDLTWAVTKAYLDGYSIQAVATEMLAWAATKPRDIGGTTRMALTRLATGDPLTSGLSDASSCGNGSLMRCLPTALIRADNEHRRFELAQISAITHAHQRCVHSCIAYGEIAATLLNGRDATEALAAAQNLDLTTDVAAALTVNPKTPVDDLATSGYVIDSLRCAVWAIQQRTSLEETLIALVNRGDDADTTGAIAGGLLGIQHGVNAIPTRWLNTLEYRPDLEHAANRFAELRQ